MKYERIVSDQEIGDDGIARCAVGSEGLFKNVRGNDANYDVCREVLAWTSR